MQTSGTIIRRPASKADIERFAEMTDTPLWPTAKAWVGELDGEIVALGGFALVQGRWIGFVDVTKRGRKLLEDNMYVRAQFMRAMIMGLREMKTAGARFVYVEADTDQRQAEEVIRKLGFEPDPRSPRTSSGRPVYRLRPEEWQE